MHDFTGCINTYLYFYRSVVSGYVLVTLDFTLECNTSPFYFYRFPISSFKHWYVTLVFLKNWQKLFEMYWLYIRMLGECGHHHSADFFSVSVFRSVSHMKLLVQNLALSSLSWFETTSSFVMSGLGLQLQKEIVLPLCIFIFVIFIIYFHVLWSNVTSKSHLMNEWMNERH